MWISNFSWNGEAVWMYEAILYITVAYILLCKLNGSQLAKLKKSIPDMSPPWNL